MNAGNVEKILAVLTPATKLARGRLLNPQTGQRCALGELAHAAGVPDDVLGSADWDKYAIIEPAVLREFGLSRGNCVELTAVNDAAGGDVAVVRAWVTQGAW